MFFTDSVASTGNGKLLVYYNNWGSYTQLGSTLNWACGYSGTLKIEAIGTTITVYNSGTQKMQVTDSTISSGSPGIGMNTTVSNTRAMFSTWTGGPIVPPTAIKTVMGLSYASVKTVNGLAMASVKTVKGLA